MTFRNVMQTRSNQNPTMCDMHSWCTFGSTLSIIYQLLISITTNNSTIRIQIMFVSNGVEFCTVSQSQQLNSHRFTLPDVYYTHSYRQELCMWNNQDWSLPSSNFQKSGDKTISVTRIWVGRKTEKFSESLNKKVGK